MNFLTAMPYRRIKVRALIGDVLTICLAASVAACGGKPADVSADEVIPVDASATGAQQDAASDAAYRRIEVKVGDDQEIRFQAVNEELLRLAGGCDGKAPMSIGFQSGELYHSSWRYFAFDSDGPVSARQLGEIPLDRVTWDDGVVPNEKMGVNMPDRFEGKGTLTITRHEASLSGRRMEGAVSAVVENKEGEALPLLASFSVPLACWSVGLD